MENSMQLQKVIFIIFHKTAGWKVFFQMNGNLKLFISRIYKNLLCHEKTKYDILFSFMSNSPFKGKVTLLGCCVLTANCMNSSLCAVYGGLPSSFSGLCCPNHSPFFFPAASAFLRLLFPLSGSLIPKFLNLETPPQILAVFNGERGVPSLFIHCDVTTTLITSTDEEKTWRPGMYLYKRWCHRTGLELRAQCESELNSWLICAVKQHCRTGALKAHQSLLFHTVISWRSFFFIPSACIGFISYPLWGASRTKQKKICSACEGWKVTLGDDRGTKKWRKREEERKREWGNEEGRLAGKERWGEA